MTQAHEVLASGAAVVAAAIALGLAGIATLMRARSQGLPSRAAAPAPGVFATGYRYCPNELRTRACIVHTDGTARCLDCGTHIPEVVQ